MSHNEQLTKDSIFYELAQKCAEGDAEAMCALGDWFEAHIVPGEEDSFAEKTSNFWHYRAMKRGSKTAEAWVKRWKEQHPNQGMPGLYSWQPTGEIDGWKLQEAGFLFFKPDECYCLSSPDEDGVVTASVYCGDSGWDEDGYGSEIEYDWYYLDQDLNLIGSQFTLRGWSRRDLTLPAGVTNHAAAAEELRRKRKDGIVKGR